MTPGSTVKHPPPRTSLSRWYRPVLVPISLAATVLGANACAGGGSSAHGSQAQRVPNASSPSPSSAAQPSVSRTSVAPSSKRATSQVTTSEPAWSLPNPLSRMVVLDAGREGLVIAGGLTASDTSASGIFHLDLTDGALTPLATLPEAVHDAAGAVIDHRDVVIGGGSTSTYATVQAVNVAGGTAAVVSNLPQPRSDDSATTVGSTTVVVGGYDGADADPAVLTTTTGTIFSSIGSLVMPVRYGAAAGLGQDVYVFGGLSASGPDRGQPVDEVQRIDLATGATSLFATMPEPLEGASAFVLRGRIFVAGGDSAISGSGAARSSGSIWAFDPGSTGTGPRHHRAVPASFTLAGTLSEGVSNAGTAVTGGSAWLVGGEHDGTPISAVQQIRSRV